MRRFIIPVLLSVLFLTPFPSFGADSKNDSGTHQEQGEAPKADSVWGALKYTGYHIEKGGVKAGHGIKTGGKAMGRGFKKAGKSIKKFFVGGN